MRTRFQIAVVLLLAAQLPAHAETPLESTVRLARLELDTGNAEHAAALFENAVAESPGSAEKLAPERAWAYVKLGNEALGANDYTKAARYYALAAAIHPSLEETFIPQWAFVRLQEVNDSLEDAAEDSRRPDVDALMREVAWVLEAAPNDRQALFMMGMLHEYQQGDQKATAHYLQALKDRRKGRDRTVEGLRKRALEVVNKVQHTFDLRPIFPLWAKSDAGPFKTFRRGPFIIHHHNGDLAERVAEALQHYRAQPALKGVLEAGGPFPEECHVYIHRDAQAFLESGGQQTWAGGRAKFTTRNDKLYSCQIQLYQTTPELTESAVPHELAHVRLLAASPFIEKVPLWLQEGVATSTESPYKKEMLAAAIARSRRDGSFIHFKDLLKAEDYPANTYKDVFYGECLAAVESLVDGYGQKRFWQFVAAIESMPSDSALRAVYGLTPSEVDALIADWTAPAQ